MFVCGLLLSAVLASGNATEPKNYSGVYPHLAFFNDENECGTGAVVPWAGKLWTMTYGPHLPFGSSDKLYEIAPDLTETVRPESIGGTPANRMIHRESRQLFIGPYAIDEQGNVRVIPVDKMPGRLTGSARHLTDPENKIYCATMEEGFYEIDVRSLEAAELYPDNNLSGRKDAYPDRLRRPQSGAGEDILPGYHGKGFYSGAGRLVYANNGEQSPEALTDPSIPSGALGEWNGVDWDGRWRTVRRNQFCEVTGPGGIFGNPNPADDPIWATGWDQKSLLLLMLDDGQWRTFRLPKTSHCYDGAHGWNTEWPRIRSIAPGNAPNAADEKLLMTMHGMFWDFPKNFSAQNAAGIRPKSTYLKVIGDFARWDDFSDGRYVVFGCDDTAQSEFLNKRRFKGNIAGPGQSQSNLWFVPPEKLDSFGPPLGRGAVWYKEPAKAETPSDAILFAGFARRSLFLATGDKKPATVAAQINSGNGKWRDLREIEIGGDGTAWISFEPETPGEWIRLVPNRELPNATALFYFNTPREPESDAIFDGLAEPAEPNFSAGLIRARGARLGTANASARVYQDGRPGDAAYYELDGEMNLSRKNDPKALNYIEKNIAIPTGLLLDEPGSILVIDDQNRRYRLPKSGDWADGSKRGLIEKLPPLRSDREVCTERDLFHAAGIFYELPAENAGGFIRIRPIAAHNKKIVDYCSYRGLLLLTGVSSDPEKTKNNPHIIRSDDGKFAVWAGAIDDLWRLGKPTARGGPWRETRAESGTPSDPYLINGFESKRLELAAKSLDGGADRTTVRLEADFFGDGEFHAVRSFELGVNELVEYDFPDAFGAYWVRLVPETSGVFTAQFIYE